MKRKSPLFYIIVTLEIIISVILMAFLVKNIAKKNSNGTDRTITSSLVPMATQKPTSTVMLTPALEPTAIVESTSTPELRR